MTEIRSFSGAHPFRPQCLVDSIMENEPDADRDEAAEFVAALTAWVDAGKCLRCEEPLPEPPTMPAGSRLTRCRCAPICSACGEYEAVPYDFKLAAAKDTEFSEDADEPGWLVEPAERDRAIVAWVATGSAPTPAILSDGFLVTEDGASPLRLRDHPGGWAEFGYNDSDDQAERER